jgi:HAD superfamily hydrolase (TIGR01549 family)
VYTKYFNGFCQFIGNNAEVGTFHINTFHLDDTVQIVANGGVMSPVSYHQIMDETTLSEVMVARGAMGNPWIFDYLKSQEYQLGCVTNKSEQFTHPLLKVLGIFNDFKIIISGDTLAKRKPDPMPLLYCAEHFNLKPEECLMLGDSVSDVKAARAAGFDIICMSYGYNHGNDIGDENPDLVIDSMNQLSDHL